ncbi:PEP-CTERM sorting domain-containing protein [Massilia sp. ST3]|uniref:PEP-CTERM sorting domain-containing protein n=1 Tax=Massilia sp. ST3 TaxID=2824903 RepID=UPI001B82E6AE|nr:PEP-CTERM sorting domain-containing protein [Massilia sp. ST3]MBQ5948207.1 PEP-CTERM sorting domain-containing protein [Massilia sp. ST3]
MIKKFAAIGALCCASIANAGNITTGAVADDWFGSNDSYTAFTVSGDPGDGFLRTFGFTGLNRSALEFSLDGLQPNHKITSATFTITSGGTTVGGASFNFWGYGGDGAITDEDGGRTGTLLLSTPVLTGKPTYTVDATSLIQSLLDDGASHAGFLITLSSQGDFIGNDLCSREGAMLCGGLGPQLSIDFEEAAQADVPEPASLALFGASLAALAAARRRKASK